MDSFASDSDSEQERVIAAYWAAQTSVVDIPDSDDDDSDDDGALMDAEVATLAAAALVDAGAVAASAEEVATPPTKKRRLHGKQAVLESNADDNAASSSSSGDGGRRVVGQWCGLTGASPGIPRSPGMRKSDLRGARCGLTGASVRFLSRAGWPIACFNLLAFMMTLNPVMDRNFSAVEFFSGVATIASAFNSCVELTTRGLTAKTYDIIDDATHQNLNTPAGLLTALWFASRICRGGLSHWATVCSTWIFMSRSSTGRSSQNIWGRLSSERCAEANAQVARMVAILMLIEALNAVWIVEQPMTSLMHEVPYFRYLPKFSKMVKVHTWMGAYGGRTRKATYLLSGSQFTKRLKRKLPATFRARDNDRTSIQHTSGSDSRKAVSGGPGLKETQAYPVAYGSAVLDAWESNQEEATENDAESISDSDYQEVDFEHAKFHEACDWFGVSDTEWAC